jgi:hypothetical protein
MGQGDLFLDKRGFVLHKQSVQGILVCAMGADMINSLNRNMLPWKIDLSGQTIGNRS